MKSKFYLVAGLAAMCGMLNVAHADATWTTKKISGDTDIVAPSSNLILIGALDFGPTGQFPASDTLNTVTFNLAATDTTSNWALNSGINLAIQGSPTYSTLYHYYSNPDLNKLSVGYQNVLNGSVFGGVAVPAATSIGFTLTGLTEGVTYEVRLWSQKQDLNDSSPQYLATWSMDGGTTISGDQEGNTTVGSYFDAIFTADSTTATFTGTSMYGPALNAVEILEAVPEPSTIALLSVAFGLIGLVAVRRFRAVPVG